MSAIQGTFVSIKTMADGTPRIVLDLQCGLPEVAALGMIPGTPFALARLTNEASVAANQPKEEAKERPGPLCVVACNFSKDKQFWHWLKVVGEDAAKQFILDTCGIESRRELDTNILAAEQFHSFVRIPFLEWRDGK